MTFPNIQAEKEFNEVLDNEARENAMCEEFETLSDSAYNPDDYTHLNYA